MQKADLIIAVSNYVKKNIVRRYGVSPEKIRVVHNGGVTMDVSSIEEKPKNDDKVVLFAGRVTLQKGPEFFVEAAKKVLEVEDKVKFVVAGTGDQLNKIIEKTANDGISDKFLFTGFYTRKDAEQLFKMADAERMATISAWAVGSFELIGIFPPSAMTLSFLTSTAPTGTSSLSLALRAAFNAYFIHFSSSF